MAKKVKKAPIVQTHDGGGTVLAVDFGIPGVSFRWINGDVRNAMQNWDHWKVVERKSELGEKIATQIGAGASRFYSGGDDSLYFRKGDLVLAWAEAETVEQYRKGMDSKADDRLRQVVKDKTTLRETYISTSPQK